MFQLIVPPRYYRNANGCVVAFSTVDRDSFEAVEKWKSKVRLLSGIMRSPMRSLQVEAEVGQIPMVLVQVLLPAESHSFDGFR